MRAAAKALIFLAAMGLAAPVAAAPTGKKASATAKAKGRKAKKKKPGDEAPKVEPEAPAAAPVAPAADPAPEDAASDSPPADATGEPPADASSEPVVEDEVDGDESKPTAAPVSPGTSEVLSLSADELRKRIREDVASLGSMSIGRPSAGGLVNGVRMPDGEHWVLMEPGLAYGTQETVDFLQKAILKVHEQVPGGHKLYIGHLSAKRGGYLNPHKSHQAGRDVDISYFYLGEKKLRWYVTVNADNLDRERTWAFVRALITETQIQYIFINTSVQKLLKEYALSVGEDKDWLDSIFQYGQKRGAVPVILHAPGHDTHIHVRFFNPVAEELGRRAYADLVKYKIIKKPSERKPGASASITNVQHRARRGDLLSNLARRYGCTVEEIQRLNNLRGNRIVAGRVYLIPKKGTAAASNTKPGKAKKTRSKRPRRVASARVH